ncbi:DUF3152 domain-containing protein [Pseudonocardia oceani]|nr:DUF3152 domain-containing protein [Pseudonocardia oceani]
MGAPGKRIVVVVAAVALGAGLLAVSGLLPGDEAPAVPVDEVSTDISTSFLTGAVAAAATAAGAVGPPAADAAAGILEMTVPQAGTGALSVVAGSVPAPGPGEVRTVRVEVEDGLPVDGARFAEFALATLNDPRSWGRGGTMSFARTDGDADIVVVLASPDTSAALCRPLVTYGKLSCRTGSRAVLTLFRWVGAHPDYGDDRTGYRRYLVNHEVGHVLGHGHESCPGPGERAPVMQQQTKGLLGCAPNSWPYPDA